MERQAEALKLFVGLKRTNALLETVIRNDIKQYGLNVNEFAVLELLYHKGKLQVQTIKEKILVANSSTSYLLDKLCEKKLCKRQVDERDKRVYYVDLTPKGRQLIANIFPCHAEKLVSTFDRLSDSDIVTLRQLLKKMSGLT